MSNDITDTRVDGKMLASFQGKIVRVTAKVHKIGDDQWLAHLPDTTEITIRPAGVPAVSCTLIEVVGQVEDSTTIKAMAWYPVKLKDVSHEPKFMSQWKEALEMMHKPKYRDAFM